MTGNAQHKRFQLRVLAFTGLSVVTVILSARLLGPPLHFYVWPYFLAATTIALFISLNVDTSAARHFAIATIASNVIFGIAGVASVVLFLIVWDPRREAPGMALLLPVYLLVATNLLVWPPGARLLLRTPWAVAISLGIVVVFALPLLMFVGAVIAALVWRPS